MSTDPTFHREAFRVRAYEADATGCASLLTLSDYFQEAAGNHALARGFARLTLREGTEPTGVWVLRRLRIEADRLPAWQALVTVETWPSHHKGLHAFREYVVRDNDGERIAAGTSSWFVLDVERRRPARLPPLLSTVEMLDRPRPLDGTAPPLPFDAATPDLVVNTFAVRRTDLDLNGHANHVRFVEWAMASVPAPFAEAHVCMGFDLRIDREVVSGETVTAEAHPIPDGWAHRLRRGDDTLARLTTRWVLADTSD